MDDETRSDMRDLYFNTVDIKGIVYCAGSNTAPDHDYMVEQVVGEWLVEDLGDVFDVFSCADEYQNFRVKSGDIFCVFPAAMGVGDTISVYGSSMKLLVIDGRQEKPELGWWGKVKKWMNKQKRTCSAFTLLLLI